MICLIDLFDESVCIVLNFILSFLLGVTHENVNWKWSVWLQELIEGASGVAGFNDEIFSTVLSFEVDLRSVGRVFLLGGDLGDVGVEFPEGLQKFIFELLIRQFLLI